jgi:hypothetical protein
VAQNHERPARHETRFVVWNTNFAATVETAYLDLDPAPENWTI